MCDIELFFLTLWFIHVYFEVLFTSSTFFSVSWVTCLFLIDSQEFYFYTQSTNPFVSYVYDQYLSPVHPWFSFCYFYDLMKNLKIFFNPLQSHFCPHHCTDTAVLKVRSVVKGRSRFLESKAYGCTLQDKEP